MAIDYGDIPGASYGSVNANTFVTNVSNAGDEVVLTGAVNLTTKLTLNNSNFRLIGGVGGSLTHSGSTEMEVTAVGYMKDLTMTGLNTTRFLPAFSGGGLFQNVNLRKTLWNCDNVEQHTVYRDSVDATGLIIDGSNTVDQAMWGAVNNLTLRNSVYRKSALIGSNMLIEDNTFHGGNGDFQYAFKYMGILGQGTSYDNIVRNNQMVGGREESTGYETLSCSCYGYGTVSNASSNTITCNAVVPGSLDQTINSIYGSNPFSGTILVGRHITIVTGNGKGKYFRIIGQSGNQLTIDLKDFNVSGISSGDYYSLNSGMVDNLWEGNTVSWDSNDKYYNFIGYNQHSGLSLWGACCGNVMRENTTDNSAGPTPVDYDHQACGFHDLTLLGISTGTFGNSTVILSKPNSNNQWVRNQAINCYEDFRIGTFAYGGVEWIIESSGEAGGEFDEAISKPAHASPVIANYKTQLIDNTGENKFSTMLDIHGAVVRGNTNLTLARASYSGAFWESANASGNGGLMDGATWWTKFQIDTVNYIAPIGNTWDGGPLEDAFWPRLTGAPFYTTAHDLTQISAEVTQVSLNGTELTFIKGWGTATVKYKFNGDLSYSDYSGPITLTGQQSVEYYSTDGVYTEDVRTLSDLPAFFIIDDAVSQSTQDLITMVKTANATFTIDDTVSQSTQDLITMIKTANPTFTIIDINSQSTVDSIILINNNNVYKYIDGTSSGTTYYDIDGNDLGVIFKSFKDGSWQ